MGFLVGFLSRLAQELRAVGGLLRQPPAPPQPERTLALVSELHRHAEPFAHVNGHADDAA